MSYGHNIGNNDDYVTVMSYDEFANIQDKMEQRRSNRRSKERKNRVTYFRRQRMMGVAIGVIGAAFLLIGSYASVEIMQFFGAAVGLAGLFIFTTDKMIIIDSYYLECHDRMYDDR